MSQHGGTALSRHGRPLAWACSPSPSSSGIAALLGLLGNRALARSANAVHAHSYSAAVAAAQDARRWQPWSSAPWAQIAFIRRLQGNTAGERAAYKRAIAKDPHNWELWLGLVSVSHGAQYKHALRTLSALSPAAAAGATQKRKATP